MKVKTIVNTVELYCILILQKNVHYSFNRTALFESWQLHTVELYIDSVVPSLYRDEEKQGKNLTNKDSMMSIQLMIFRRILLLLLFKSNNNLWLTYLEIFLQCIIMEFKSCEYIETLPNLSLKASWILTQPSALNKREEKKRLPLQELTLLTDTVSTLIEWRN